MHVMISQKLFNDIICWNAGVTFVDLETGEILRTVIQEYQGALLDEKR